VIINVETHISHHGRGFLNASSSTSTEHLRFNFDTGNIFISGKDPLEYLKRFRQYVSHLHIKDNQPGATAVRGEKRASPAPRCRSAAASRRQHQECIAYLKETGWSGVLSIECFADDNIRKSIEFSDPWLRTSQKVASGRATAPAAPQGQGQAVPRRRRRFVFRFHGSVAR
jgi:sugar phosphate isomerase/epimerase